MSWKVLNFNMKYESRLLSHIRSNKRYLFLKIIDTNISKGIEQCFTPKPKSRIVEINHKSVKSLPLFFNFFALARFLSFSIDGLCWGCVGSTLVMLLLWRAIFDSGVKKNDKSSIGSGKTIVEFFSAAMLFKVWRYLSWIADEDSLRISAASLSARDDLCSPSAAITYIVSFELWNSFVSRFLLILHISYLSFCLSGSFCFCCHCSLKLYRQTNIFYFHSFYFYSPNITRWIITKSRAG